MGMEKVSPARAANLKVLTCSTPCSPCPTEFIASHFRGGRLKPSLRRLIVGSWNVEGFTDTKLEELQNHMFHNHIGVLCLQETHRTVSEHYITDSGFLVILSGEEDNCFFFFLRSFFLAEGLFWMTVLLGSLQAAPFLYRRLRMCMKGWAKSKPQLLRGGLGDGW